MSVDDVLEALEALQRCGASVWVDGGWGVDALLEEQTRAHDDLDLAVDAADVGACVEALAGLGYAVDEAARPGAPARVVLRDASGREVDLHPLTFDAAGNGWQRLDVDGRTWGLYDADGLGHQGRIGGRPVRCLAPLLQLRFHLGYAWTSKDEHDVLRLHDRFGIPLPPGG